MAAEGEGEDVSAAFLLGEEGEGAEGVGEEGFDLLPGETAVADAEEFDGEEGGGVGRGGEGVDHLVDEFDPGAFGDESEAAGGDFSGDDIEGITEADGGAGVGADLGEEGDAEALGGVEKGRDGFDGAGEVVEIKSGGVGGGHHHGVDEAVGGGVAFDVGGVDRDAGVFLGEGAGLDLEGLHPFAEDAAVNEGAVGEGLLDLAHE